MLGFGRSGASPTLATIQSVTGLDRQALFAGGLSQTCNLSGVAAGQSGQTCSRSWFYPYGDGQFVPAAPQATDPLVIGDAAPLPAGTSLYVEAGCTGCEGYGTGLYRVTSSGNAAPVVERIPEPQLETGEVRTELGAAPDGSLIVAVACLSSVNCGPLGPTPDDSQIRSRVLASSDGGQSWRELARYQGYVSPIIGPGGRVAVTVSHGATYADASFALLNPAASLSRPASLPEARPVFFGGELVWWDSASKTFTAQDGSDVAFPPRTNFDLRDEIIRIAQLPNGNWLVWWSSGTSGSPVRTFIGLYAGATGAKVWAHEIVAPASLTLSTVVSDSLALGVIPDPDTSRLNNVPVLISLDAGSVTPIAGPFAVAPLVGRNWPVALGGGR